MIPDCEGYWWFKGPGPDCEWIPQRVGPRPPFGGELVRIPHGGVTIGLQHGTWGDRLYAPDEYPRYLRITGEPIKKSFTSRNCRVCVDYDAAGEMVGIEILHAEDGK